MKNTLLVPALAACLLFASCQKSSVSPNANNSTIAGRRGADDAPVPPPANLPAAVQASFTARYPTATRMEWQAEDGNTWKVKFFVGTVRWKAFFRADGTFIAASLA